MPTSIIVYRFGSEARDELASCALALLNFYGGFAVALCLLLVIESHFGMFDGLSVAQTLLMVTGMDLVPAELVSTL